MSQHGNASDDCMIADGSPLDKNHMIPDLFAIIVTYANSNIFEVNKLYLASGRPARYNISKCTYNDAIMWIRRGVSFGELPPISRLLTLTAGGSARRIDFNEHEIESMMTHDQVSWKTWVSYAKIVHDLVDSVLYRGEKIGLDWIANLNIPEVKYHMLRFTTTFLRSTRYTTDHVTYNQRSMLITFIDNLIKELPQSKIGSDNMYNFMVGYYKYCK